MKINNKTFGFAAALCLSSLSLISQETISQDSKQLLNNELIRKQQLELEGDSLYYKAVGAYEETAYDAALDFLDNAKNQYIQAQSSSNRLINKLENVNRLKSEIYKNLIDQKLSDADIASANQSYDLAKKYLNELKTLDEDNEKLYNSKLARIDEMIKEHQYRKQVGAEEIQQEELVKKESIDVLMSRAQLFFDQREFIKCREELEEILLIDKFNLEANHLLFRVHEEVKILGETRNRLTQSDLLAETSWKWEEKIRVSADLDSELLNSISINEDAENTSSIHEKLRRIYIPSVSYDGDGIDAIVEDLIRKSKEFDPDPEGKGINIVYFASKAKAAQSQAPIDAVDDGFDEIIFP